MGSSSYEDAGCCEMAEEAGRAKMKKTKQHAAIINPKELLMLLLLLFCFAVVLEGVCGEWVCCWTDHPCGHNIFASHLEERTHFRSPFVSFYCFIKGKGKSFAFKKGKEVKLRQRRNVLLKINLQDVKRIQTVTQDPCAVGS